MRELWWAACGRWDVEVFGRWWWKAHLFGGAMSGDVFEDMHPLRRLEKTPPTPAQEKAEAELAWTLLGKGLAHLNGHRKG